MGARSRAAIAALMVAVVVLALRPMVSAHPDATTAAATEWSDYHGEPWVPEERADGRGKPNIVLITTDDQTLADLKWMRRTQGLLGDHGVTFDRMLSPHPLCCPARAEILTGQYAQSNGVHSNGGPYGGYPALVDKEDTLGWWMAEAGYRTAMIGKFLNYYKSGYGFQPGWDYWNVSATNGFGYRSFRMFNNGEVESYEDTDGAYSTDYVRDRTVDQILDWSIGNDPFFIWSSFYAPHGTCDDTFGCENAPEPAPRHEGMYADVASPSLKKPSATRPLGDVSGLVKRGAETLPSKAELQARFVARIEALESVDEAVQRIVLALQAVQELDDTYLIFTSDNGYLLGEHQYVGKTVPYEESVRVPLIIRGPDVPAGVHRQQAATTVDLATTIAALGGAEPGRVVDGRNLMPTVRKDAPLRGDTVLIQGGPPSQVDDPAPWLYRGVRTARYTFVSWRMMQRGKTFYELYDRKRDPFQMDNLWEDAGYRPVLRALLERTKALADCNGTSECFREFGPLPVPRR